MSKFLSKKSILFLLLFTLLLIAISVPNLAIASGEAEEETSVSELDLSFMEAATIHNVPRELLISLGWVQSRLHQTEHEHVHTHNGEERVGLMQLQTDKSFNQVAEAAALLGVSEHDIKQHVNTNVAAAAVLLREDANGLFGKNAELKVNQWHSVLAEYSGLRADNANEFANDVMGIWSAGLKTDIDGHIIHVAANPDIILVEMADDTRLVSSTDYGPARWVAPYSGTYTNGSRGSSNIDMIVIHTMQGYYQSSIDWLTLANRGGSVHYWIKSTDGSVTQTVRDEDIAWHAGHWTTNSRSIGIEHEGFINNPNYWYTDAMYQSSAALVRHLSDKYNIPKDRNHIIGHTEAPGCVGGTGGGASCHTDPGTGWDWDYFMGLVNDDGSSSGSDIIVDDGNTGFSGSSGLNSTTTNWYGTYGCPNASDARYTFNLQSGTVEDWGKWQPTLPDSGMYDVYFRIPGILTNKADTGSARYVVKSNNGTQTITKNQNNNYCTWTKLGNFPFNAGTDGYVYLGDVTGETNLSRTIVFDAMKFVRTGNLPAVPGKPSQIKPTNNTLTTDNTPTIDWGSVSGATGYQVQVDNNSNFSSPNANKTLTSHAYTTGALADGKYYWRARAQNGTGWGAWTSTWAFTIDRTAPSLPTLNSPTNNSTITDDTPTWKWNAVSGATQYQLQVDDVNQFTTSVNIDKTTSSTSYTHSSALGFPTYYYRVRAKDTAGNWSAWSAAWKVTIDKTAPSKPVHVSPANNSVTTDNAPKLDWNNSTGSPSKYEFQFDNNSNFSSPSHSETITNSEFTVSAKPGGVYYWRVRSQDAAGNWSTWSSAWKLTIDRTPPSVPVHTSPANNSVTTDNTPKLDWSNSTGSPTAYQIQFDNNSDFSSPSHSEIVTNSEFVLSAKPGGVYYWRAQARDRDETGNWSAWSSAWKLTIDRTPPSVPVLASPANNSVTGDNTPKLDWSNSTGSPTAYQIQLDNNSDFSSPSHSEIVANSEFTLSAKPGGVYYWRARARDRDETGNWSAWSSVWKLTIDRTPPSVPAPQIPVCSSTTADQTPTFDWNDVSGTTEYQIQVSTNSTFSGATAITRNASYYAVQSNMEDGVYYWRLRGKDTVGNWSNWSSSCRLTIAQPTATTVPPTVTPTSVPPTVTPTQIPPTVTPTSVPPTVTSTQIPPTVTPTPVPPTLTPSPIDSVQLSTVPQQTNVSISSSSTCVDINIANVTDLGGYQLEVTYPKGKLTGISATMGDFPGSTGRNAIEVGDDIDNATGKITLAVTTFGTGAGPNGSGTLAEVCFDPTTDGTATIGIAASTQVTDTLGTVLPNTRQSGTITISSCYWADLDCDGDVDIVDIQLVAGRWGTSSGDTTYGANYDIDNDDDIDIVDVQRIASEWGWSANNNAPQADAVQTDQAQVVRSTVSFQLDPSSLELSPDETKTIAVQVKDAADLSAIEAEFHFDSNEIQIESVALTSLLSDTGRTVVPVANIIDNDAGKAVISVASFGSAEGITGNGAVIEVTVKALTESSGSIDLQQTIATDSIGAEFSVTETDMTYTIVDDASIEEPEHKVYIPIVVR